MNLDKTLVLITGASGGIGAATAIAFAKAGSSVILIARTEPKLEAVARQIRGAGGEAHVYPCDVSDGDAVDAVAARIKNDLGVPDVLINNAGAGQWLAVEETPTRDAVAMMGAPYFAAFFVTRAFVGDMIARGSGRIANVNSPMAYAVIPGAAGYAASRSALRALNDSLRSELRGTGVGVTHFVFGEVTSDYFENNPGSQERIPAIGRIIPIMSPEQTADHIVRGIQRDKDAVARPFMVWVLLVFTRLMPRTAAWLNAATGWRRTKSLP